jgi:hypothetical protein
MARDGAMVKLKTEVLKEVEIVNEKGEKEIRLVPASRATPTRVRRKPGTSS